jgi:hypothetical protein
MVAEAGLPQAELAEVRAEFHSPTSRRVLELKIMNRQIHHEYYAGWDTRLREVRRAVRDHENLWKPSENMTDFMKSHL